MRPELFFVLLHPFAVNLNVGVIRQRRAAVFLARVRLADGLCEVYLPQFSIHVLFPFFHIYRLLSPVFFPEWTAGLQEIFKISVNSPVNSLTIIFYTDIIKEPPTGN